jgi:hypothetical protein
MSPTQVETGTFKFKFTSAVSASCHGAAVLLRYSRLTVVHTRSVIGNDYIISNQRCQVQVDERTHSKI